MENLKRHMVKVTKMAETPSSCTNSPRIHQGAHIHDAGGGVVSCLAHLD